MVSMVFPSLLLPLLLKRLLRSPQLLKNNFLLVSAGLRLPSSVQIDCRQSICTLEGSLRPADTNKKLFFSNCGLLSSLFSSRGSSNDWKTMETIKTGIRVSSICGNSWGVDIVDWSGNKDVVAVFGLLKLNKLGISRGISFDRLKSSGLVLDGLLGDCRDGMDGTKTKTISTIDKLRSPVGSNGKGSENNQELHIGLTQSELLATVGT